MILLWFLAAVAALLGLLAYAGVRRVSRRLELLSQSYWELKYQHGQLRAQVARLDPEQHADPQPGQPAEAFVPLSAVKR